MRNYLQWLIRKYLRVYVYRPINGDVMRESHRLLLPAQLAGPLRVVTPNPRRLRLRALAVASAASALIGTALACAPSVSAASSAYAITELPVGPFALSVAADQATDKVYVATGGADASAGGQG